MKYLILVIGCYLGLSQAVLAQTNLLINPGLEPGSCFTEASQLNNCPWIGTCIPGWFVSHGTPESFSELCVNYDDEGRPVSADPDRHIFMACRPERSEGILQNVKLSTGCYKMYLKYKTGTVSGASSPNPKMTMSITLNRDINFWDDDQFGCQQPLPPAVERKTIFDNSFSPTFQWKWIDFDFKIEEGDTDLDKLIVTGFCIDAVQIDLFVDCIYLYSNCGGESEISFTSPNVPDGVHTSCSSITAELPISNGIDVPTGNNFTDFIAEDYIRLLPNFRARHNFRAAIEIGCGSDLDRFQPPCCIRIDPFNKGRAVGDNGQNHRLGQIFETDNVIPQLYPNPTQDRFMLELPEGEHQVVIYNSAGSFVYKDTLLNTTQVDVKSWPKGIYFIEISNWKTLEKNSLRLIVR